MRYTKDSADKRILTILRLTAIVLWGSLLIFLLLHRREINVESVLNYTPSNPLLAALVIESFFVLKSISIVFYSGILYIATGFLFPLPVAILLNVLGTILMILIPYAVGRRLGSSYASSIREKRPAFRKIEKMRSERPIPFIVLLRCVKIVNFDLGSMYLGAVSVPLPTVIFGSLLGMLPDMVLYPIIGENLTEPTSLAFWLAIGLDVLITVIASLFSRKIKR